MRNNIEFIEVKLVIDNSQLDLIEGTLLGSGFNRFFVEFTPSSTSSFVIFYFENKEEMDETLEIVREVSGIDLKKVPSKIVAEKDWLEPFIESLKPFEMIEDVWIIPLQSVEEKDSPMKIEGTGIKIKLIPGTAFGTGLHETTKIAAQLLKKHLVSGMDVLDLGCGSGILSVLALKLGASKVVAVDNDPFAVKKTLETFEINDLKGRVMLSDLFEKVVEKYDLIVSNILFEVLVKVLKDAKKFLKENGELILSGITTKKVDEFLKIARYNEYEVIEEKYFGDWYGCTLKAFKKEG